jgi:hypothetical protein
MATPEEKITELENQVAILKTDLTTQRDKHEKLDNDHKNHKTNSKYLHTLTPFLALFAGLIIN